MIKITNIDTPAFTLAKIAAVAGLEVNTLRSWYQRGHIKLAEIDKPAEGNGLARLLSGRSAIAIAIMAELVRAHMLPQRAGEAGEYFAHHGLKNDHRERSPGCLWSDGGATYLAVPFSGTPMVLTAGRETPIGKALNTAKRGNDKLPGAMIFELTDLVDRTRAELGLPRDGDDQPADPGAQKVNSTDGRKVPVEA